MADPPRYPDTGDETGVGPDRRSTTGTPRCVKVSGVVALVVVLLFVILMLTGVGREHGPDRHTPPGEAGGRTPSSSTTALGVQLP
ncbi:MAG: hypothetical protein ACRDWI_05950 [Jiangellaceae bacterium]